METKSKSINWKYAVLASAVGLAATAGFVYYYKNRKFKNQKQDSIEESEFDITTRSTSERTPKEAAIAMKDMGNKYYKAGNYEKALEYYNKALEFDFGDKVEKAKIYQNKAVALENLQISKDEILKVLDAALELHPKYEKALARRSKLYEELGRHREALTDITAALYFDDFKSRDYMNRLDVIITKLSTQQLKDVNEKRGYDLLSDSHIKNFFESLPGDPLIYADDVNFSNETSTESSKKANEDDIEKASDENSDEKSQETNGDFKIANKGDAKHDALLSNLHKCHVLIQNDEFNECFSHVRTVLEDEATVETPVSEVMSRLLLIRATFYILSCHEELALHDLERIIVSPYAQPAVTVNALVKKALVKMTSEKFEEAEATFKDALQIDPELADIYYHRASLYESTDRFQEAVNDCEKAVMLNKDYSFAAVHGAFNKFRINPSPDMTDLEKLIQDFPNSLECYLIYSQILLNMGRFDEVTRVIDKFHTRRPRSAPLLMVMAMAKLSQGKDIDCKKLLHEGIKIDPKYPYCYQTLASVYMKDGDFQVSLELLDKAVSFAKNMAEVRSFIATRETVRAQLQVSLTYHIQPAELFAKIMRSVNPMH